jgi:hypothetical protein
MSTATGRETLDDLYRTPAKAELIGGRIVNLMPIGVRPSEVASNIYVSLRAHSKRTGISWRRGDAADAEPAVPGWRISVDEVFA